MITFNEKIVTILSWISALQPHILIFGSLLIFNHTGILKLRSKSISKLSLETKTTKIALQITSYINGSLALIIIPHILAQTNFGLKWFVSIGIWVCFFVSAYYLDYKTIKIHTKYAKVLAGLLLITKLLFAMQLRTPWAIIYLIGDLIFAYIIKVENQGRVKGDVETLYLIWLSLWMIYTTIH